MSKILNINNTVAKYILEYFINKNILVIRQVGIVL